MTKSPPKNRICKICNQLKDISLFISNKKIVKNKIYINYSKTCRECNAIQRKIKRQNNPEAIKKSKEYYEANKEKIKIDRKIYRNKNQEKIKNSKKAYYENNKEKIILKIKENYFNDNEFRTNKILKEKERYEKNKKEILLKKKIRDQKNKKENNKKLRNKRKNNIHLFEQSPNSHLSGGGCDICARETKSITHKSNLEEFITKANKIHNKKYNYDKSIYKRSNYYLIITCDIHGDFLQSASNHLSGAGCHKCSKIISKAEISWLDHLNIPNNYRQQKIKINNKLFKLDAFDPITNTIYEFYGDFWHGNPKIYNANDINPASKTPYGELYQKTLEKETILKKHGYKIISIWESEWKLLQK